MGCVCATAKKRRRQALNDYRHLAPRQRPGYKRRDAATAAKRLQRVVERERAMNQRKGNKK
jgi:hypothetical protein